MLRKAPPHEKKSDWLNPKIDIRPSHIQGKGMFANSELAAGETVVIRRKGYTDTDGGAAARQKNLKVMQWDENIYSVETGGPKDNYAINHACEPNTWMTDAFALVARRKIKPGEELTADYAFWITDEKYLSDWQCRCGSPLCRRQITGTDWRKPEIQNRYRGHFSPLLNKRIQQSNQRPGKRQNHQD